MKIHEMMTPETWCQRAYALDDQHRQVPPRSPAACRWCAVGWLIKTFGFGFMREEEALWRAGKMSLTTFNDTHTFEEVRDLLRRCDL